MIDFEKFLKVDDKKPFVVGVVGTQCVGKSTFVKDLVASTATRVDPSLRYATVGTDYRQYIEARGLSLNRKGNAASQKAIFDFLVMSASEAVDKVAAGARRVVLDRTPLDAYVYTRYLFNQEDTDVTDEMLNSMWRKTCYAMRTFDCIAFIPLELNRGVQLVDDKFRDTDPQYRRDIDAIFQHTLGALDMDDRVAMICGRRDVRVAQLMAKELAALSRYSSLELVEA